MQSRISRRDIILIIVFLIVSVILFLSAASFMSRVKYYGNAMYSVSSGQEVTESTLFIEGKDKMNTTFTFDKDCYINLRRSWDDGSEWLAASKAMYDTVNIQLYRVTLTDPVSTSIYSSSDAKNYCKEYVDGLPNVDNSIVVYDYMPEDWESDIYVDDTIYYGDNVFKYLTSTDMEMIDTVIYNDYILFPDYTTRTVRTWELIADNLINGYDRNLYKSDSTVNSEWDIEYYKECRSSYITYFLIFLFMGFVFLALTILLLYHNIILPGRMVRVEIERQEAENVRTILEAEVESYDDTQSLVNKYLDED